MEFKKGITIIGSGNVAWHLSAAFKNANIKLNYVLSRKIENAKDLAKFSGARGITDFNHISKETDIILICVSDNAIQSVADEVSKIGVPYAHTAASIPLSVFKGDPNSGVFYPFQTFTRDIRLGEPEIPVFLEAYSDGVYHLLENLAKKITEKVAYLDSEKRKILHISGIIANNFSNYFYTKAFKLLDENDIDPKVLIPLIQETVNKIRLLEPEELQTGPARRGSMEVIESHARFLRNNNELKDLYTYISNSILEYYNKNG